MQAIVITKPGEPSVLEMQERPIPLPSAGEVLIRVKAAGVNRPDLFQRKGNYPPPPGASPDIPGLEVAGIVDQCGPGCTRWKRGDRVCALLSGGGYAEYAAVAEGLCLPVPEGFRFEEAAVLPETLFTVWHNVFQRGQLKKGERFLVHGGSGGIGMTAIQLTKAFGAIVLATAGSQEKCLACLAAGADLCINYKEQDFEQVLALEGADLILDTIGGDYTSKNLRLLKPDGRLVFLNAIRGAKAEFDIFSLMARRLTITGSTLRGRNNQFKADLASEMEKYVWPLLAARMIRPLIYREFNLGEAAAAHEMMESSIHIGKIVLRVG